MRARKTYLVVTQRVRHSRLGFSGLGISTGYGPIVPLGAVTPTTSTFQGCKYIISYLIYLLVVGVNPMYMCEQRRITNKRVESMGD